MKTYDEIYDIIYNQLGLKDQASYKAYIDEFHRRDNPRIPTAAEIDLLSPENIDNRDFWLVAERIFSTDPVANCQYKEPMSIEEANLNNLCIYHTYGFTGMLSCMDRRWVGDVSVLEIGPGYGAFKGWIEQNTRFSYYGADVYPRIAGVDQNEPTGLLSETTKARQYSAVISCNVFQHLSTFQRRRYYEDVAKCLVPGGLFMVSMMVDNYADSLPGRDEMGRFHCKHYGQFTEIQKGQDILNDLAVHFRLESQLHQYQQGYLFGLVATCQKKAVAET